MAAQRGKGEFGYGSLDSTSDSRYQDGQFGSGQSNEFADLSQQVSSAIFKISNNVTTLEKAVRQLGTPSDSTLLRNRIQASIQTTNKIVSETTTCLKDLTLMSRNLGKSSRLQVDRLTNEYHESVQRYSGVQKKVASKMRSCPNVPPKAPPTSGSMDVVQYDESKKALLEETRRQGIESQLQVQDQQIDYDMNLLQEREEQIRQIEAAMLDVNEIFRDLSAMVSEQGEVVDSIEANIEKASSNVEGANTQLQTASRYQKKARRKMCCCIVIMAITALIITIILIVELK
ncbi:syntaxin-7-like isoform X1 [Patiria miniata]|uniref:t-SNARE coiled-coil homology domain-containing protein n=1 Tax=Patiria miniata TaxID=46514 RepID=A0A914A1U8_PATMI|nr:syntaxin-7-like isoform X1 [Patiria miniata]